MAGSLVRNPAGHLDRREHRREGAGGHPVRCTRRAVQLGGDPGDGRRAGLFFSYRTSAALGSNVPVVWSIAMLIPLLDAITLLVLSAKSTNVSREAGVAVGFFGPKPDSVGVDQPGV